MMRNAGCGIAVVAVLILFMIVGWFVGIYNNLQVADEKVTSNWAQINNQLQRRNDLIPNLVETVKGYAAHENEVFTNIAEARSKLAGSLNSSDVKTVQQNTTDLNNALSRLLVLVERYPELKADKNFMALQDELAGTENRLAVARRDYNESVRVLNARIRTFPTAIVAGMAGIKARDYFEAAEGATAAPEVRF